MLPMLRITCSRPKHHARGRSGTPQIPANVLRITVGDDTLRMMLLLQGVDWVYE